MLKKSLSLVLGTVLCSLGYAGGFDELPIPDETKLHPIVAAYYSYLSINTFLTDPINIPIPRLPGQYNGLGMQGGFKYGECFGLFLGYDYYPSRNKITTLVNNTQRRIFMRPNNTYFEIRGYYPILYIEGLSLVGAGGAEISDFSFFLSRTVDAELSLYRPSVNVNLRVGLGIEYFFNKNWGLMASGYYVPNHVNDREAGGWTEFWSINLAFEYKIH